MCTVEKVSPFLLHLPEDIKPDELFHCISQVLQLVSAAPVGRILHLFCLQYLSTLYNAYSFC